MDKIKKAPILTDFEITEKMIEANPFLDLRTPTQRRFIAELQRDADHLCYKSQFEKCLDSHGEEIAKLVALNAVTPHKCADEIIAALKAVVNKKKGGIEWK